MMKSIDKKKKPLLKQDSKFSLIPVDQIVLSQDNPRKHFQEEQIEELAVSIEEIGLIHPILVRPAANNTYEIISGERRWRACKKLKKPFIECFIHPMDDKMALQVRIVENIQRQNLNPIEEAQGYKKLLDGGMSIAELSSVIGKGRDYISRMVMLLSLPEAAKEAIITGKMAKRTGWYIARIPVPKLRAIVASEAIAKNLTVTQVAQIVLENYLLDLRKATFSISVPDLVPGVPSCLDCSKRTGNSKDLFDDIKDEMICTDPECFAQKREADWRRQCLLAHTENKEILNDEESFKHFVPGTSRLRTDSQFVDIDDVCEWDKKERKWSSLLAEELKPMNGRALLRMYLARSPMGTIHSFVKKEEALLALRRHGITFANKAIKEWTEKENARKERKKKEEFLNLSCYSLLQKVCEKAKKDKMWSFYNIMLCLALRVVPREVSTFVFQRHHYKLGTEEESMQIIEKIEEKESMAILLDLFFSTDLYLSSYTDLPPLLVRVCKILDIDVSKVVEEINSINMSDKSILFPYKKRKSLKVY
ncbi:ParB/RepB/Spo0J family partition protein [Methylacidiphilum caldifontis]|nr:ParB/RepB/Spo0J family partition protein [Methylacidiphilum caldifontis]